MVWLENKRWRKRSNPKLQPKLVGPYHIEETYSNHIYLVEGQGQVILPAFLEDGFWNGIEDQPSTPDLLKEAVWTSGILKAPAKGHPQWMDELDTTAHNKLTLVAHAEDQTMPSLLAPRVSTHIPKKKDTMRG